MNVAFAVTASLSVSLLKQWRYDSEYDSESGLSVGFSPPFQVKSVSPEADSDASGGKREWEWRRTRVRRWKPGEFGC